MIGKRSLVIHLLVESNNDNEPTLEDIRRIFRYDHFTAEFIPGDSTSLLIVKQMMSLKSDFGGRVYDQSKTDEGWKPNQKGGVVTAEPDSVARARQVGEKQAKDGGGDMKL